MNISRNDILRSAARLNFWLFCCYYDFEFFFEKRSFLYDVAILFQRVIDEYKNGNSLTVSVKMPPRSGKSYITSLFAAYWLATFPELSVMRNSCTTALYQKFSYDTRNIIKSKKFKEVFPEIELQPDKKNIDGWNLTTSKQVGYFGAGVGGTIIGFGANIAISDDLYKSMQDAMSSSVDVSVKMWKESAHDSRMEKNCPEIFIGTRWQKNDVIGIAEESGRIKESITIPAMINNKSFCEDVKSTKEYHEIMSRIAPSIWEAEYMQNPKTKEGILLPIESLTFADLSKNENVLYRYAVGDPADTGGDKFNCLFIDILEIEGKIRAYVNSVIHTTEGTKSTVSRISQRLRSHKSENIFYEKNGIGLAAVLLQQDDKPDECKVVPFSSTENKDEVRILSFYEFIQMYFIFDENYKNDPEYFSYIIDLTNYSKQGDNKHKKDAIDNTSSAAKIMKLKYKL